VGLPGHLQGQEVGQEDILAGSFTVSQFGNDLTLISRSSHCKNKQKFKMPVGRGMNLVVAGISAPGYKPAPRD
jgi:hypothetical protein